MVTQNWETALFQDLGSSPASMKAGKAVDAYGCMAGHSAEQADAEQAYCQSMLQGEGAWVRLPQNRWPDHWFNDGATRKEPLYWDPVCELNLALYGHPMSGKYWEDHAGAELRKKGWKPIEEWKSCYYHPELDCLLVIYVDDF